MIDSAELEAIRQRCDAATSGPWESFVEGRDHLGGNDFIRTGGLDDQSPDIELLGASIADQDFIAHAREDIPRLLDEIERLKKVNGFVTRARLQPGRNSNGEEKGL